MYADIYVVIALIILLPLGFLPTIIALMKNHPYKIPIILINILGGLLFGLGWLVALVWCFIIPDENSSAPLNPAGEIEKLHALLEKGILTQDEFDTKKRALLNA